MKIQKFEKDIDKNLTSEAKAKFLAKKISKKFFSELDEFDRIVVNYDNPDYLFYICFNVFFSETIEQIKKFNEFFGFRKNGWSLQAGNFTYDDIPKIYESFHLPEDCIDKYLDKFKLEEDAEKYNL